MCTGSRFHIPESKATQLDLITKGIYVATLLCELAFACVTPAIFFTDIEAVMHYAMAGSGLPYGPAVLAIITSTYCISNLYLQAIKWLLYPMLFIPALHYCTHLISKEHTRMHEFRMYRGVYVLVGLLNGFFRVPFAFFNLMMIVTASFGFTLCLIFKVSFLSLALLTLSAIMLVIANVAFNLAKHVFDSANQFIQVLKSRVYIWKRIVLIHKQSTRSLRECRIYCGPLCYVDRGLVLKVNNLVLNNTVSNVIMFKRLWNIG